MYFIRQLSNKFNPKNSTRMHCYGYNDAVNLLNKAKCQIRRSVENSKNFEIHLNFVSLPACRKTRLR